MVQQLSLATFMAILTVLIHLTGLALLVRLLRSEHRLVTPIRKAPLATLLLASLGVILIHTVEIWTYAFLYLGLDALHDFETALYFSTVTYASVGYGDVLLGKNWRILGAIEGATGIIMLGWSTAFLVSLLARLKLLAHDWLSPDTSGG
ncbi:potassium channel family protein [Sphingomonas alba]|uniref:Potassium channel family protein n=1 Tax=Sphingomonas alba TaxID=2908208 RepID=A0ABT0RM22_9SPHN|nr:potassium channel family protein [Sphingomonas alba]MCL6683650.1 potassium channel family protein [Sphingomonas alba]